ncbi:putative enhancer of polycomb-like protein 1 [Amylocarpus encephaloides]|uniref:Enhancer of polycomb-like protein n=1 Tax=Amylocarpus encephaloides TaxID=45428 RepID=A0A9P7YEX9_9HELO|nr:putative enhancer of polycomb-like protein 1 [Amylocarpus encephaloides]
MAPSRVVRQRKLNKGTPQVVLREDQIESTEYASLQNQYHVETGVERSEENEYHLQAALKASSGAKDEVKEIPAPPAQESSNIKYDALYARQFHDPYTYIRFSNTVEEASGCSYDMTTEDDDFLKAYNQKRSAAAKCSEDDFEKIMDVFEQTAQSQAPYASVDNTLVPFERMESEVSKFFRRREFPSDPLPREVTVEKLVAFAKDIYDHWKDRRQASCNNPIQPSLKLEIHQENDDGDPYVCFRRREVRPTRKTRARDVQSTDKLKKLRREIEQGFNLVNLSFSRELTKRDMLKQGREIFESRAKFKLIKVKLGIKSEDEEYLINQKPQRRKQPSDFPQMQRTPGTQIRLPGRSDGRPLEADLVLLSDLHAKKEHNLQRDIEEKTRQHLKWNANHIDLTREPLSPVVYGPDAGFRPATAQYQYLMTPPSSVTSECFDQPSPSNANANEILEPRTFRYSTPPEEDEQRSQPAYRRRIGRGGRLWIDRRGMSGIKSTDDGVSFDRWKYDQDDDDEQPVYEMDPYDTKALRFRATIPFPQHLYPQRPQHRPAAGSPPSARPAGQQQPPPPAVAPT